MTDGNKESAKELLSTFRTLTALALALLIFSSNRSLLPVEGPYGTILFAIAFVLLALSVASAIYVCLIVIPKLARQEDEIIRHADVMISSLLSLCCFAAGCLLLIVIPYV